MRKLWSTNQESGAIAVMVAIIASSSLLIGLFVMVSDVSTIYTERRVVQNAADSAVLAVAQECASNGLGAIQGANSAFPSKLCSNQGYAFQFATYYANVNSPDQRTSVSELCGSSPFNACASQPQGIFACKNIPSQYTQFVRISTRSNTTQDAPISPIFSQLINSNSNTVAVSGCAQAVWGNSGSASIALPFSLSICDYQISGSVVIDDFPSNQPILTGGCNVTDLSGQSKSYATPLNGFALTTEFKCPSVTSSQTISVGQTLTVQPSLTQIEKICSIAVDGVDFYQAVGSLLGSTVYLPAVGNADSNGQGSFTFKVAGFFAFDFLGAKFPSKTAIGQTPAAGWASGCKSNRVCLYGTFNKGLITDGSITTDPLITNTGIQAVQLLP